MFNWYRKLVADASQSNHAAKTTPYAPSKEIEREVFSEEFEWIVKERVRKHYYGSKHYDIFVNITL